MRVRTFHERRTMTRLTSADVRSDLCVGMSVVVVFSALLYWLFGLVGIPEWFAAIGALAAFGPEVWRDREYVLIDDERFVSVSGGKREAPIWWDTVASMSIERRQDPRPIRELDDAPRYVIVVLLKTGEEVPLWAVASNGGDTAVSDPAGRIDAILERLQAAHRPADIRKPTAAAGRPVRVRPVDYRSTLVMQIVLAGVLIALLVLAIGLPWWVGGFVIAFLVASEWRSQRCWLLVDDERIVPVVGGVRRRAIWWDTVESLSVDRRRPPDGASAAFIDADEDEVTYVIIVHLKSGDEVPLWAVVPIGGDGVELDSRRRTNALLERLAARRPGLAFAPAAPTADAATRPPASPR